jgi:hypothetical protein
VAANLVGGAIFTKLAIVLIRDIVLKLSKLRFLGLLRFPERFRTVHSHGAQWNQGRNMQE